MDHVDGTAAEARAHCWARQGGMCALCWKSMGGVDDSWEAHHRLRRRDLPGWCPCNIVGLHARCHTQGRGNPGDQQWAVHDWPDEARVLGLVVPTHADPRDVQLPQWGWMLPGPVYLSCDGMVESPDVHVPLASAGTAPVT